MNRTMPARGSAAMGATTKVRSRGVKYKPVYAEEGSGDATETSSSTRAARRAVQPKDNYKMVWTAQAQRKSILVARNESYPSLSTESHSLERRKRGNQVRTLSTPARIRARSVSMGTRRLASGEFTNDKSPAQRTESFSTRKV